MCIRDRAMDDEIKRQRFLVAKVGSTVRIHANTCKSSPSAQARFDDLKSELRRIIEWLKVREDKLEDEYKSGDSYVEAFYEQLVFYADGLERKYSPYTNEVRRLIIEEAQESMEEEESQYEDDHFEVPPIYSNTNRVVVVDEDENTGDNAFSFDTGNEMESRRIFLREAHDQEDPTGHMNPRLDRYNDNLINSRCVVHERIYNQVDNPARTRWEEQVD